MKIIQWAIDRLIPYARNARKIPPEAIAKVAASIKEFGWRQPIVVDSERVVVAGHVRLLAAKQLGLEKVPVHVAADLTPGQIKAFRLMDNRSHQESGWDMELFSPEIAELQALKVDVAPAGFDPAEIEEFLGSAGPDGGKPFQGHPVFAEAGLSGRILLSGWETRGESWQLFCQAQA